MKKILFVIALSLIAFSISNAQLLLCSTYTSNTLDTVTINGTNGGSDWFTNDGYDEAWVDVYNGTKWETFKIGFPVKFCTQLKVYVYGADSSFAVQGNVKGKTIDLPILDGYATTNTYTKDLNPTSMWVRFLGIHKRDL